MQLHRIVSLWTWLLVAWCVCFAADVRAASPAFIWLEGEQPDSVNFKPNVAGWGHKEFLSGEKWLHISIDAGKVDKELPAEGIVMDYAFKASAEASYEIWNRIGFEFVRSPFEWRVDAGAWTTVSPNELTTDLMELDFWWKAIKEEKMLLRKLTGYVEYLQRSKRFIPFLI
jgi:beta-galactosidase